MEFTSRQLRAFHLVAQHRNFTRAAEALFLTPSGLSVLIRELERQLGFRVFDRTTRQVTLTAQGSELLAVTGPSLRSLDAAMLRIERSSKGSSQRISIGTTPWFAAYVLPPAIREFRQHQPNLHIRLFDGGLDAIAKRVEAGKLDLGLGIFKQIPGLRRVPFFRFSLMLARPDSGIAFQLESAKWPSLNGQTLISLTKNYPHQQLIYDQLDKAGVRWKRGPIVNLLETQLGLVEANQGMAVVPSFGMLAIRNRKITMSELVDPVLDLAFYEISNRGRQLPAEAAEFSDFLKAYIARWAGEANRRH
jgi:LysR family transcriptional regulator, carnitine catabolism transcriptional activator